MFFRILKDIKKYWLAIGFVMLFYFLMHTLFGAFCPSVLITGLPCPGCGLTRSFLFFVTGQWQRSFSIHPLGGTIVAFLCYCGFFRYIKGKKIPGLKWMIGLLLLVAIVLYAVRMMLYFPDRAPYTYNRGNLLERILPFYRDLWL